MDSDNHGDELGGDSAEEWGDSDVSDWSGDTDGDNLGTGDFIDSDSNSGDTDSEFMDNDGTDSSSEGVPMEREPASDDGESDGETFWMCNANGTCYLYSTG